MDHTNNDCLIVTILSHGNLIPIIKEGTNEKFFTILAHDQLSHIAARDELYPLQMVFSYFTDEKCPSLKNKPKLFFIQTCQGTQLDEGFELRGRMTSKYAPTTEIDVVPFKPSKSEAILPQPDFLVAYATLSGFYSFREQEGSWFIQSLCKELKKIAENNLNLHLMQILTFVTQSVAIDYESCSPGTKYDKKKQTPCVVSMLRKLLYF